MDKIIKNKPFIYSVAFLSLTVPAPGRFVYGLVLVVELILLELAGLLTDALVSKLKFEEIRTYFVMFMMISLTMLFRNILAITYSEIALTLGFLIYFPTVSVFILQTIFSKNELPLPKKISFYLIKTLKLSLLILIFFLFRDIAGFGTFTFFGQNHTIFEIVLLNPKKIGIFMFFASIPGCIILVGVLIYLYIYARNKILLHVGNIVNNTNEENNK